MTESTFIDLALVLRVLLVGGILLVLPRIGRKGLLFGTYVGEAEADREGARHLLSRWSRGCVGLMVVALATGGGISWAGHPVAGNLSGTAVLLLGAVGLYAHVHRAARELALPAVAGRAALATAPLVSGERSGVGLATLALVVCFVVPAATLAYLVAGSAELHPRALAIARYLTSINLLIGPFLALMARLTASAKRSIRAGSESRSVEAQSAFRSASANYLSWTAIAICAFLTVLSLQILIADDSTAAGTYVRIGWLTAFMVLFFVVSMAWMMRRFGQGGSRIERPTSETPLTNGLADDRHWVFGLFFVDRDDPSILVEKRFGFGYTFNYGNRTALLIVGAFLTLVLALVALDLFVAPAGFD